MSKGPVIYLEGYRINKIKYEADEEAKDIVSSAEPNFTFEFGFTEDYKKALLTVDVELFDTQRSRFIQVSISGNFNIPESEFSSEEIQLFVAQNGSAILFPYLRATVSMITTLDGPSAVVLPTLNMIDEITKTMPDETTKDPSES